MTKEGTLWKEFMHGGLTRDEAYQRLVGLGYLSEDAEDLVSEWIDIAESVPFTVGK